MKNVSATETEPKLAPPGAGIPFPMRLVLRFVVNPFVAGKEDPAVSDRRTERLHAKIEDAYLAIPEALRGKKVLVPPQRGLEDSSRYWSAAMVLEHMEIVDRGVAGLIIELSNHRRPTQEVKTELVKPVSGMSPTEAYSRFRKLRMEFFQEYRAKIGDLNAPETHAHPWFGEFTARKWNWLLGMHAGIHLQQLLAIRERVSEPGRARKILGG